MDLGGIMTTGWITDKPKTAGGGVQIMVVEELSATIEDETTLSATIEDETNLAATIDCGT